MLVDSKQHMAGLSIQTQSPLKDFTGRTRLEFYRFMNVPSTDETAALNVFIVDTTGVKVAELFSLTTHTGTQSDVWKLDTTCTIPRGRYRVVFEVVTGARLASDVAIDAVKEVEAGAEDDVMCDVTQGSHFYTHY